MLHLAEGEGVQHKAGAGRSLAGVQLVAEGDEAVADLFGAGSDLGAGADGHIGKAVDDFIDVHALGEAGDGLEVAGAAAFGLEVADGAGVLVDIYHEDLGADALGIENILHILLRRRCGYRISQE